MSTPEVVPVFRDFGASEGTQRYLQSWSESGEQGVPPKENRGVVAWRNKKRKWVEGKAGTNSPLQSSPPPSHTCSLCWCPGEGVVPASFQPSQGGTRKEHLVPLGQLTEVSFLPRKPPHHNLCLCLHRTFSLLISWETQQR